MKSLKSIRQQLGRGEFRVTDHALSRMVERNISKSEISEAGAQAQRIEDYPDDKYSPSCLLLGFTKVGRPLHIQVSYADTLQVKVITVYEPNLGEWDSGFSKRRS